MRPFTKIVPIFLLLAAAGWIGWEVWSRLAEEGPRRRGAGGPQAAPVEVAPVRRGPIELRRIYSGTLEPRAEFVVAPKVGGRIEELTVDLSDTVERNQVVVRLDDDEFVQAVSQAQADLAVARANESEAKSAFQIAQRELERAQSLREEGIASAAQTDTATARHLAAKGALEVARAQTQRAEASLEAAKIRLGYTQVTASWTGTDRVRIVGERYVQEGDTVSANRPMMSIVSLDPIKAVVFATEKDYGLLEPGQAGVLTTDAFPDRTFGGNIARISSVFRRASRQARVELEVDNPEHELKPGMFVRAQIVLKRLENAVLVPEEALVERDGETGVFLMAQDEETVVWRPVAPGIREGGTVEVRGDGIEGRVVTLGQQLIEDGSRVLIPEAQAEEKP